jgi:hypothetical protein
MTAADAALLAAERDELTILYCERDELDRQIDELDRQIAEHLHALRLLETL